MKMLGPCVKPDLNSQIIPRVIAQRFTDGEISWVSGWVTVLCYKRYLNTEKP